MVRAVASNHASGSVHLVILASLVWVCRRLHLALLALLTLLALLARALGTGIKPYIAI